MVVPAAVPSAKAGLAANAAAASELADASNRMVLVMSLVRFLFFGVRR
jgi:flagellar biogenesis protein FliO